jgi:hypothetical protein
LTHFTLFSKKIQNAYISGERRGCGEASIRRGLKMTNEEPLPKKVRLDETDFKVTARDKLILRWKQQEACVFLFCLVHFRRNVNRAQRYQVID